MELDNQFSIQFSGLKPGKHLFKFDVEDKFFEPFLFEGDINYQVNLKVNLELEKLSTMLILTFKIEGYWETDCDRCGDDLKINILSENTLYVKFGSDESDNEDIVTLGSNEYEINISPYIYEYFLTSLPSRKVHEEGKCDELVLAKLEDLTPKEEISNPIWDKLKEIR